MSDADLTLSPAHFSLWREVQDTRTRTRLGGIYYLLAWLLCWLFSAEPAQQLAVGLAGSAFFSLLLAARLLHRPPEAGNELELKLWLDRHWGVILLSSLGWGLAHAWVLLAPSFQPSSLIGTLATIAFSTAMTFNFAMRRRRAALAILLLYVPGLVVLGFSTEGSRAELITLVFYLSYLLLALNRSHREYGAMLELELQLLEQRQRLDTLSRTDGLTQLGNRPCAPAPSAMAASCRCCWWTSTSSSASTTSTATAWATPACAPSASACAKCSAATATPCCAWAARSSAC
jgi:hypothetical protein